MARTAVMIQNITVNGNSLAVGHNERERDGFLLEDVDKKQQLVEQAINPPGQERYITPLDRQDLLDWLNGEGDYSSSIVDSGSVTSDELDDMLADTRGSGVSSGAGDYTALDVGDDISRSNVKAVLDNHSNISGTTDDEADGFRDRISDKFLETGSFLLSFDDGVVNELQNQGWIKVFPDNSSGLFTI